MVATRDFKAGDVIFRDDPIVLGPKQISEPVCLGCYRRVDGSYRYTNLLLTVKYHFYNSVTSITNLLNLRSIERDLNITIWSTIKKKISWNDRDQLFYHFFFSDAQSARGRCVVQHASLPQTTSQSVWLAR